LNELHRQGALPITGAGLDHNYALAGGGGNQAGSWDVVGGEGPDGLSAQGW
jgi:hypothetical protein